MQKLPKNKANFIFKKMQDFNQTTHVGPQDLSVFTDNISFYFYPVISIKNLMKQSCNGTVISTRSKNFPSFEVEYALQNAKCVLFNMVLFDLDCTTVSKWQKVVTQRRSESEKYVSISFNFEFYFKNCMQNYPTMYREHSGKKLLLTTKDILHKSHFKFRISEPHGLQISKFLIFSYDEIVVDSNGESDR